MGYERRITRAERRIARTIYSGPLTQVQEDSYSPLNIDINSG
jgi:hypothetical protein